MNTPTSKEAFEALNIKERHKWIKYDFGSNFKLLNPEDPFAYLIYKYLDYVVRFKVDKKRSICLHEVYNYLEGIEKFNQTLNAANGASSNLN